MSDHRIAYFISLDSIHCKKWIKHLCKNNKCIIITYRGMSNSDIDLPGVNIYNLFPKQFPVKNFISRWTTLFRISLVLKKHKITLIHSMYCYPNAIWAGYFKSYKKMITTRGSDVLLDYKNTISSTNRSLVYLKNKLEEAFCDCSYITSTSLQQKQFLIDHGIDASKISVVRTGIEPEKYNLLPTKPFSRNEFHILSPRSVQKNYNIHTVLQAINHILKRDPGLKIHFDQVLFNINPEYLQSIYKLVDELGLKNNVDFIPPYDSRSASSVFSQYDLVIMIPQSDGTPVSALEVMIHKKPLIISRLPYDKDLISEEFCWLVDQNDAAQIANLILKLWRSDPNEISLKTEKAYDNVLQNANTHHEMKKVLQLYNSIKT